MHPTRKQRAKERHSRQADLMSDLKNWDILLGSYSGNEIESNSEDSNIEVDLEYNRPRPEVVQNGEDFRSLSNSNSIENSDITFETMRLVNSEVSEKIDEFKMKLNSQIAETINLVISEKILPNIQNFMTSQNPVIRKEMDHRSRVIHRTAEMRSTKNAWKSNSKPISANGYQCDYLREDSDISQSSDEDHDSNSFSILST